MSICIKIEKVLKWELKIPDIYHIMIMVVLWNLEMPITHRSSCVGSYL